MLASEDSAGIIPTPVKAITSPSIQARMFPRIHQAASWRYRRRTSHCAQPGNAPGRRPSSAATISKVSLAGRKPMTSTEALRTIPQPQAISAPAVVTRTQAGHDTRWSERRSTSHWAMPVALPATAPARMPPAPTRSSISKPLPWLIDQRTPAPAIPARPKPILSPAAEARTTQATAANPRDYAPLRSGDAVCLSYGSPLPRGRRGELW